MFFRDRKCVVSHLLTDNWKVLQIVCVPYGAGGRDGRIFFQRRTTHQQVFLHGCHVVGWNLYKNDAVGEMNKQDSLDGICRLGPRETDSLAR